MEPYKKCKICSSELIQYISSLGLVKCNKCGLIFFEERVNEKEVEFIYEDLYQNSPGYQQHKIQRIMLKKGEQPPLGYNKKFILREIFKHRKQLIIAEIGAGVGVVAKNVIESGHNYVGFEVYKEIAEAATAEGLNIKPIGYEGLKEFNTYFDTVLAFEVLEHIEDIDDCLKSINKSLKNGGLLAFTVPNTEKYKNYERIQSKLFQDHPPVHVNFFTIKSIERILAFYGFEPIMLKVRKFPFLNMKDINTYKFLFKMIYGKYYGPSILCIARKMSDI